MGFLEMLRPYKGLQPEPYEEIMAARRVLAPVLRERGQLDRQLINALWGICNLGRHWGTSPDGMLRRDGLITDEDAARLTSWIDQISWTVGMLLDGQDDETAFSAP